jgi:hypothetical protein
MQVSAEVRWFWADTPPSDLADWYRRRAGQHAPGGGLHREDVYLLDTSQVELGLKTRGTKPGVEIKGLVRTSSAAIGQAPLRARAELWTKWSTQSLDLSGRSTVTLDKQRWLRQYDTSRRDALVEVALGADEAPLDGPRPQRGCHVEWTCVRLGNGRVWWTLGCESFGARVEELEDNLGRMLEHLAGTAPPALGAALEASYPTWLARHAGR